MIGGAIGEALSYLIELVFGLLLLAVALRFLLAWVRADFYNPVSQFIVTITNPLLRPLRRVIPGYAGVDWPSLVLMLALKMGELAVLAFVAAGRLYAFPGLLTLTIAGILQLIIYIFMFAIIIQVVLSWISPGAYNPVTVLLYRLTEPLLRPARRLAPPIAGLDFSPVIVIVLLQLSVILLVKPLIRLGLSLS
jgi:YggT family protein